jgi:ankyrin repeat protein
VGQVDEKSSPKAKPKLSSNDLWQAASNGDLEAINILHKAGNSLDEKDASGWTPLFWGVAVDGQKAVKLLLDKGAKVNLTNNDGQTPLDWAIQTKKNKIAELLKKHGAKRGNDL